MSDEYNGWPNRETWAANVWLSNTESTYLSCQNKSADEIKEFVEELKSGGNTNEMFSEIGSLWRVDWSYIAESFKEQ